MSLTRWWRGVELPHPNDFPLPHQSGKPTPVYILLAFPPTVFS